eukprot:CAMPEP_0118953878 /NCGR_PEP_ID=MMETSP1169-20130426/57305_1 /TAXON_ID=36882 /ORGANISM="Pyramimonas obovata, Strain CCMP722" /LENGTH=115 /DNA_ID=CAMNT_0006901423 /DNA_START=26 /DNA_END=373 /DNA_ORIENTATION=-
MGHAEHVCEQLRAHCEGMQLPLESCGDDTSLVRRSLVCGYFLNAASKLPDGMYRCLANSQTVALHPSSILFNKKPDTVLYNELVRTSKLYIREVSMIEMPWLTELAPVFYSGADT